MRKATTKNRQKNNNSKNKTTTTTKTTTTITTTTNFQKLIERDNSIVSVWRALNVFTKGHRSTSADIPKNLTANVFNNHFLSVSESLIEPRTNVYECSNSLHDFCKKKKKKKKIAGKTHLSSHICPIRN